MDNDDLLTELIVREYQSRRQRNFQAAEAYTRRIIEVVQNDQGPEHRELCQWYGLLGGHLIELQRYSEAESSLNLSLKLGESGVGETHPRIARTLNNLGLLYSRRGVYDKAEEFYKRCLQIEENQDKPAVFWIAQSLSSLGSLYATQNKLNEAELALARALAVLSADESSDQSKLIVDDPSHLQVRSRVLNDMGTLALRKRDYENAEWLFQKALAIRESIADLLQFEVVESMSNLVSVLELQGKTLEATAAQERLLVIVEQQPEMSANGTLANVLFKLSAFYDEVGLPEEGCSMLVRFARISPPEDVKNVMLGLEIFTRSPEPQTRARTGLRLLRLREEVLGAEHTDVLKSVQQLVDVYRVQGRDKELIDMYARLIALSKTIHGEQDLKTAQCLDDYGLFQLERKNYAEASAPLEAALAIRREVLPSGHLDVRNSFCHLAFLRVETDDQVGANELFRQSRSDGESTAPQELLSTALFELAVEYQNVQKIDHALWLASKALLVSAQEGQSKTIYYSRLQNAYGVLLKMQAKFDESLQTFRSAIELVEEISGVDSVELIPILINIVKLFYSQAEKRMEEGESILRRSLQITGKAYGARHAESLKVLRMLASHVGFTDGVASERLYQEALSIIESSDNRDIASMVDILQNLFYVKRELAKYTEAEEVLRRAISIQKSMPAVDANDHAGNEFHYGEFLLQMGKNDEGESAFQRALELWKPIPLNKRDYYYSACLRSYSKHLRSLNRIEQALALEEELQEVYAR